MPDLTIKDMFKLQQDLHAVYAEIWEPLIPETAVASLLWAIGEAGEVIDILKKEGCQKLAADPAARARLVEETCDVLMYLVETLL